MVFVVLDMVQTISQQRFSERIDEHIVDVPMRSVEQRAHVAMLQEVEKSSMFRCLKLGKKSSARIIRQPHQSAQLVFLHFRFFFLK